MLLCKSHDFLHLSRLSKQMHRDDRFGFLRYLPGCILHIDVEADWAGVHEHWGCSQARDTPGGCKEGKGRTKHFISRSNIQRHQGHQNGIRARGHSNSVPRTNEVRYLFLERLHFGTHDKSA